MADNEELLAQFMSITGVDNERATFYLEAAGWNMDVAMGSFYDHDGDEQEPVDAGGAMDAPVVEDSPAEAQPEVKTTRQDRQPGIRTLGSLQATEDSEDSEEEGQAFFAGGSETSGQQILGPRRRRGEDIVQEMFKAARGHGAEEVDPGEDTASGPARPATFGGSGYRLGQTSDDTVVVPGARDRRPPQPRTVKLKLWKSGFSVDDGEVREYADPANQEFLTAIRAGQVPPELIRDAQGGEVHLDMEDHRHEDFERPKPKLKSFSGKGYVLGSPAPAVVGAAGGGGGGAEAAGAAPAAGDPVASEAAASAALGLDESQPVTSVQVRLIDGSRIVVKLNHTHTVGQLRQYISTARPQFANMPFTLLTTFPSKELADDSVTMKDGQLLNAAVLQRAK